MLSAISDQQVAHPLTYAKMGCDNLRRLCADAGIEVAV